MQCVILAGGLATRMRPLTERIPKALIPAGGRPFVDHQLAWLAGHGVTDVVMCIGYRGDAIRAHLDANVGASHGLRIRFVDEGADLRGTAGALRRRSEIASSSASSNNGNGSTVSSTVSAALASAAVGSPSVQATWIARLSILFTDSTVSRVRTRS